MSSHTRRGSPPPRPVLVALALTLIGLTGCPTRQTPDARPADDDTNSSPSAPSTANDSERLDRAIAPPAIINTSTGAGGAGAPPTPGDSAGDGSSSGAADAVLSVLSPAQDQRTRPGGPLEVQYSLLDPRGQVATIELVVMRVDSGGGELAVLTDPLDKAATVTVIDTTDPRILAALTDGLGTFRIGVNLRRVDGAQVVTLAGGELMLDDRAPTVDWGSPLTDRLTNPDVQPIQITTNDNSPHELSIFLDRDASPGNGNDVPLVSTIQYDAGGARTLNFAPLLPTQPGLYRYYARISDGVEPPTIQYAFRTDGEPVRVRITRRLVGDISVATLIDSERGGILQGFNFNDLGGSSMVRVPDVDNDGRDEMLIGSRFGKAHIIQDAGIGFGEAYLLYGSSQRLRGARPLNAAGGPLPGLIFPGLRTPRSAPGHPQNESTRWTSGLSDLAIVPDMDGDDRPEIVFSFPRAESISLRATAPFIQHPELVPDLPGMGNLEYDAFDAMNWNPDHAQFTRGGVVIVSSHNELLRSRGMLNRKSDRVIDLHEVGQLFSGLDAMSPPRPVPYIRQAVRRDALPPPRTGSFLVCADCDGELPEGCDPNDPKGEGCGNDGCTANNTSAGDGREQPIQRWVVQWDVAFPDQGPGGFFGEWTPIPAVPPLANGAPFPFTPNAPNPNDRFPFPFYPNQWIGADDPKLDPCMNGTFCEITNEWFVWATACSGVSDVPSWSGDGQPLQDPLPDCYPDNPCPRVKPPNRPPCPMDEPNCMNPPITVDATGTTIWTGFYGPCVEAVLVANGQLYPSPIGARILGQKVNDRFGTSVSSDGTWLYLSSPNRTPNDAPYAADVPSLSGPRPNAGVVYQLRTHAPLTPGGPTRTQLWIEPQPSERPFPPCLPLATAVYRPWWPYVDSENGFRADSTMPVPHNYMIESIGSLRGDPSIGVRDLAFGDAADPDACPPPYDPGVDAPDLDACSGFSYPVGTAGYYMDRTPEIVGPHVDARIEVVRALGDVNGDGIRDFAVGSPNIRFNVLNGTGDAVGAMFIVFGRPTGVEGDYLLEQLAQDIGSPARIAGVLVKGAVPGETLGRAVADAGDVNGDGLADVLLGHPGAGDTAGEVVLLFGSTSLVSPGPNDVGGSPGGGWTLDNIPAGRAIRIYGAAAGDLAGANVAGLGDVDRDGSDDILIAAPGVSGGRGEVYLIYGGPSLPETIHLGALSTQNVAVPFARFVGRATGDALGGGAKLITGTDPNGGSTLATSQGLAALGDIDGDGNTDFALSSMLADSGGRIDAGEVYVLYGQRGP